MIAKSKWIDLLLEWLKIEIFDDTNNGKGTIAKLKVLSKRIMWRCNTIR